MKNLKIYLSSLVVCAGLSLTSCSSEDLDIVNNTYDDALFFGKYGYSLDEFLCENGIVKTQFFSVEPLSFYEAKVTDPYIKDGKLYFNDSWRKIDDFSEFLGIARKVTVSYKFVCLDFNGDVPIIKEYVTDDLKSLPSECKYIYKDDHIVYNYSDEFHVNNGKIVGKVRSY